MIVKGILKSIDYEGNTCEVRIPLFESAGNAKEVVISATFSTLPGLYNGYKVNDVVFVAFENEMLSSPIILGKLYLGAEAEGKDPRGAINAENLKSATPMSLPLDTNLILDNDPNKLKTVKVKNGLGDYKTVADIIKGLQKQETEIGSVNAQIIDTGEELGAKVDKVNDDGKKNSFGWIINDHSWSVFEVNDYQKNEILHADHDGLKVSGTIFAKDGLIAGLKINDGDLVTADDNGEGKQPGKPDTLFLSSRGSEPKSIPADDEIHSWLATFGTNFGVDTNGSLFAENATFKEYILFKPLPPLGPLTPFNPLKLETKLQGFGNLSIRGFVSYAINETFTVENIREMIFDPLNPGWIDITDPGWGGGIGGGGGGSVIVVGDGGSGGSGGIFYPEPPPGGGGSWGGGSGGINTH